MDRYINPFTDYGFKKLFATEANKDILISFLNAIIEDHKDPVVDLVYKNVETSGFTHSTTFGPTTATPKNSPTRSSRSSTAKPNMPTSRPTSNWNTNEARNSTATPSKRSVAAAS